MTRVVLVHGAATTARVWDLLLPLLDGLDAVAPERPRTGDLAREVDWLAGHAAGGWVVGMSGGATLGLALAATGTPLAGALLHEPAVGSLAPGLLDGPAAAFARGGTAEFGRALYGTSWRPEMAGDVEPAIVGVELAMFRSFEPAAPAPESGRVLVTYGDRSPPTRRDAAHRLRDALGHPVGVLPGAAHFAGHDAPAVLAAAIRAHIGGRIAGNVR